MRAHARELPGIAMRRYLREGALAPPTLAPVDWSRRPARAPLGQHSRVPLPFPFRPAEGRPLSRRSVGDLAGSLLGVTRLELRSDEDADTLVEAGFAAPGGFGAVTAGRAAPSGGRLYPLELYVASRALDDLPPALYRYAPTHHALELVRTGDLRAELVDALAAPPSRGPDVVLVLSSVFWRNAFKYREFAYRLQVLEAGVLGAHALAFAQAADLEATLHLDFADVAVDGALDLDPSRESTALVITVAARDATGALPAASHTSAAARQVAGQAPSESRAAVVEPRRATIDGPARDEMPAAAALHAASRRVRPIRPSAAFPPHGFSPLQGRPRVPLGAGPVRLVDGIARRRSGSDGYEPTPIAATALGTILRAAAEGYPSDVSGTAERGAHSILGLVANRVEGVTPGLYRYDATNGELQLLREGTALALLGPYLRVSQAAVFEAAAIVLPHGDFARGLPLYGDRWYRMQNIDGGVVAARACLAASALGLASHMRCDYNAAGVAGLFGLDGEDRSPLAMVLVGRPWGPAPLDQPLTATTKESLC
jgi:SagB-type dehydrogenase family enzyme